MNVADAERVKYERVWQIPSYGKFSPGERMVGHFLDIVKPQSGVWITDFGCGSGKATRALQQQGYRVRAVDHTRDGISKSRWPHIRDNYHESCLWNMDIPYSRHGYCVDVMEHIPTEFTMLTIREIMGNCDDCFFQVCTQPDQFGKEIGEPLHLTVRPFEWWRDRLGELYCVDDARDLMHGGIYVVGHR